MGTRPGAVKEKVAEFHRTFVALIREFAATAVAQRQLPADEDPAQLAFELNGVILAADANFVLHDDEHALDVAREVVRHRLQHRQGGGRDRRPARGSGRAAPRQQA